jgi:hypothetical protein
MTALACVNKFRRGFGADNRSTFHSALTDVEKISGLLL